MEIRPATTADLDRLYRLALEFDTLGTATTAPRTAYDARMGEILDDERHLVLLAIDGSAEAGYALAQDYGANPRREFTVGRLHDLFVLPGMRRQGIARQLMAEVTEWCRNRPLPMILDWQSRLDAVPFYESLGYAPDYGGDQAEFPGFCLDLRPKSDG
ncbi:MAG: GNAT family N-acetyltransferase [Hamadaea sp.]|uniref:GNAT family N-acetyltransferase n=1 Tax=Hamadaea sp. TaxID=2024425 RepID=UPI0017BEE6A9|nr:GNAT family N-acetyltransferase [Hamadaea sp.]NUR71551.1 GNAT family N-acetyltransferase [Hamadaea sp.]NUT19649.1 GNAT family N-acetyltransferase [Hamadaea sp.]